jgi:hypothetical protein
MTDHERDIIDRYRALASEVLQCAVEDFNHLKQCGAIRPDLTVDGSHWSRRGDGSTRTPINIDSPTDAQELVEFFGTKSCDILCDFVGVPACRVRQRLDLKKPEVASDPYRKADLRNLKLLDRPILNHLKR